VAASLIERANGIGGFFFRAKDPQRGGHRLFRPARAGRHPAGPRGVQPEICYAERMSRRSKATIPMTPNTTEGIASAK
jgi:hypothetical protein